MKVILLFYLCYNLKKNNITYLFFYEILLNVFGAEMTFHFKKLAPVLYESKTDSFEILKTTYSALPRFLWCGLVFFLFYQLIFLCLDVFCFFLFSACFNRLWRHDAIIRNFIPADFVSVESLKLKYFSKLSYVNILLKKISIQFLLIMDLVQATDKIKDLSEIVEHIPTSFDLIMFRWCGGLIFD